MGGPRTRVPERYALQQSQQPNMEGRRDVEGALLIADLCAVHKRL